MGDLHEIVDLVAVERLFRLLAIVGPLAGLALGAAAGSRRGNVRAGMRSGLLVGLLATVNYVMWSLFNGLTNRNGLDTVKNFAINLAVFVAAGLALGSLYSRFFPRYKNPPPH